jgi:hypothetical protein
VRNFLLVYNRTQGRLLEMVEYADSSEALRARFDAERLHRGDPSIEVVVLRADSEETMRRTHTRYFADLHELLADGYRLIARA